MKYQLRKFAIISKKYDLEDFYNIEVTSSGIVLMGKYSPDVAMECFNTLGAGVVNKNGFIYFVKNNVKVVLT